MLNLFLFLGALILVFREKLTEKLFVIFTSLLAFAFLLYGSIQKISYLGFIDFQNSWTFGIGDVKNSSAMLFIGLIILLNPIFNKISFKRNASHYLLAPLFLGTQTYYFALIYALVTLGLKKHKSNFDFALISILWVVEVLLKFSTLLSGYESVIYSVCAAVALLLVYARVWKTSKVKSITDPIELFIFSFVAIVNVEKLSPDLSLAMSFMIVLAVLIGSIGAKLDYSRAANGALVVFSLYFFMKQNPSWPTLAFAVLSFLVLKYSDFRIPKDGISTKLKPYEYLIPYAGVFLAISVFGLMIRELSELTALYVGIVFMLFLPKVQKFSISLVESRSKRAMFLSGALILICVGVITKNWVA